MNRYRREAVILLAVVAVVGILISPSDVREVNGGLTMCKANLKSIGAALEAYSEAHGRYPTELSALTPDYLDAIPTCAAARNQEYAYEIQSDQKFHSFVCSTHQAAKSEECLQKLNRLRALQSLEPEEIQPGEQYTDLVCPSGKPYLYATQREGYRVYCAGRNHRETPENYPQQDDLQGLHDAKP